MEEFRSQFSFVKIKTSPFKTGIGLLQKDKEEYLKTFTMDATIHTGNKRPSTGKWTWLFISLWVSSFWDNMTFKFFKNLELYVIECIATMHTQRSRGVHLPVSCIFIGPFRISENGLVTPLPGLPSWWCLLALSIDVCCVLSSAGVSFSFLYENLFLIVFGYLMLRTVRNCYLGKVQSLTSSYFVKTHVLELYITIGCVQVPQFIVEL